MGKKRDREGEVEGKKERWVRRIRERNVGSK